MCLVSLQRHPLSQHTQIPTTETNILNLRLTFGAADLDVTDLLFLKLVYGLLQLPGGPCGIHGGSLELTLSLMVEQKKMRDTTKHIKHTNSRG